MYRGDLKRQFHRVMENLRTVVEHAGGTTSDFTELTIYVTDMERWRDDVSDVRYDCVTEPYPCSTLVEVNGLIHEDMMVEAKAVAHIS